MREVSLPSGATLKVAVAPFKEAKALYQTLLRELRFIQITADTPIHLLFKDFFCVGFSSEDVDKALKPCLKRCTYNGMKIDDDTFEPENARQDYFQVLMEVARDNVDPFGKALFAEWKRQISLQVSEDSQESTTPSGSTTTET